MKRDSRGARTRASSGRGASLTRFEIAFVAVLVAIWLPGLAALSSVWSEVEYASHGFLVPFAALWAATAHRVALAQLEARPSRAGLAGLGLAGVVYAMGLVLQEPTWIGLAAVATAIFGVLALRGEEWVRTLRFSLAYLVFMVPLPSDWIMPIVVRLQVVMSSVAVSILQEAGVAIYREGNVLTLPGDRSLFVAEACSGITSLITLIPIGVFIAYFTEARLARRLVLVACVVPIALAGNLLRVLLTVWLALRVDIEFATQGPLHEWAGIGTYVIGCLALLGVGAAMRRIWPEQPVGAR